MPEIIQAGSIKLDKAAPTIVDAGSFALDSPARQPSPSFQYDAGAWDRFINEMPNLTHPLKQKANNAIALAAPLDISPYDAMAMEEAVSKPLAQPDLAKTAGKSFITDC